MEDLGKFTQVAANSSQATRACSLPSASGKLKAAVEEACHTLSWIHSSAGLIPPTVDPFVVGTTTVASKASGQEGADHSTDAGSYC